MKKTMQNGGARRAEAIAALIFEVSLCFFRIRAMGRESGFLTAWGAGSYGFLRSLALLGPLTVPQIAKMRPVSRQRMQRLADELAAAGLVSFVANPRHRRSRLVRLTAKGRARYAAQSEQLLDMARNFLPERSERDVRNTAHLVHELAEQLAPLAATDRDGAYG